MVNIGQSAILVYLNKLFGIITSLNSNKINNKRRECVQLERHFKLFNCNTIFHEPVDKAIFVNDAETFKQLHNPSTCKIYETFNTPETKELLFKLHNVFANLHGTEFGIVSPIIFNDKLCNDPLKFNIEKSDIKPTQFLEWLSGILSGTEYINDMNISTFERRHWKTDYINNGNIYSKSKNYCQKGLELSSVHHSTFLTLDLRISNRINRDFIIDIYGSRSYRLLNKHGLNLHIRNRITLPRNDKVSDLENIINKLYNINTQNECILCMDYGVLNVDDNSACYIVNNVIRISKHEADDIDDATSETLAHVSYIVLVRLIVMDQWHVINILGQPFIISDLMPEFEVALKDFEYYQVKAIRLKID
eukprot:176615_1